MIGVERTVVTSSAGRSFRKPVNGNRGRSMMSRRLSTSVVVPAMVMASLSDGRTGRGEVSAIWTPAGPPPCACQGRRRCGCQGLPPCECHGLPLCGAPRSPAMQPPGHQAWQDRARQRLRRGVRQAHPRWPEWADPNLPSAGLRLWPITPASGRRKPRRKRRDQQRQHFRQPGGQHRRRCQPRRQRLCGRLERTVRGAG